MYENEKAIVDRCWKALGIENYEQAGGKAIWEHIAGLRQGWGVTGRHRNDPVYVFEDGTQFVPALRAQQEAGLERKLKRDGWKFEDRLHYCGWWKEPNMATVDDGAPAVRRLVMDTDKDTVTVQEIYNLSHPDCPVVVIDVTTQARVTSATEVSRFRTYSWLEAEALDLVPPTPGMVAAVLDQTSNMDSTQNTGHPK